MSFNNPTNTTTNAGPKPNHCQPQAICTPFHWRTLSQTNKLSVINPTATQTPGCRASQPLVAAASLQFTDISSAQYRLRQASTTPAKPALKSRPSDVGRPNHHSRAMYRAMHQPKSNGSQVSASLADKENSTARNNAMQTTVQQSHNRPRTCHFPSTQGSRFTHCTSRYSSPVPHNAMWYSQ